MRIKKSFFDKRGVYLLFLGSAIFFSLFSPSLTSAALPAIAAIAGVAISVLQGVGIVLAIYAFIDIISIVFVNISGSILNWVTSPSFISISYTNPSGPNGNLIVGIGLDIIKSTVNLFLVLFLVYIAVAIALRLSGEAEAKKSLVRLIIIALLVNFAPVLVGIIVDASNIVMNSSLVGISEGVSNFLTQSSEMGGGILGRLLGLVTFQTSEIARALIMIILNFATGIGLLLYAILFLFRYIAIWVLVILSPIAFVSWIHPATKKLFWDWWWKQLWEWSFIGAFLAFFLYLGARSYEVLPAIFKSQIQTPGLGPEVSGFFNQVFPYFVVLAFLYLGIVMGLQTAAMGGNLVVGLSKKAGGWVTGRVWRGASTWTQEKAQIRERVGGLTKKWEEVPVARWFLPERMRKYAETRPSIDEARKKLSIHSHPELGHKAAVGDIYGEAAVGGLMELVETGDSNDWFKEHMKHYGIDPNDPHAMEKLHGTEKYRKKMARLLWIAREGGYHNTIIRGAPRLAEFAVDAGYAGYKDIPGELAKDPKFAKLSEEEKRAAIRKAAIKRATEESRPQHIKNYEQEDVADRDVIEGFMPRGRDIWQAIGGVKRGHLKPLEVMGEMFIEMKFKGMTKEQFATLPKEQIAKAWGEYEGALKKDGKNGIFLYLDSARAKEQGWEREKIIELATGRRITLPKKKKGPKPGPELNINP